MSGGFDWSSYIVQVGILGLALALIRGWVMDLKRDIKGMSMKQNECRESLSDRFAGKADTKENFAAVWQVVDKHTAQIATIEGAATVGKGK